MLVADVEAIELSDEFLARLERGRAVEELSAADDQSKLDGTKIAFAHCRESPAFCETPGPCPASSRVSFGIDLFRMPLIFSHLETFSSGL